MLFERIRRTQKPVFIFLAVMFGLGFAFLGVGSGAGSINPLDLFSGSGSSSGASVSDLEGQVHDHPNDASAWLRLGQTYDTNGQVDLAIGAYKRYVALRPKDDLQLGQLAGLYERRAGGVASRAQAANTIATALQQQQQASAVTSLKLGAGLTQPLAAALATPYQQRASTLGNQATADYEQALTYRKQQVKVQPRNALYQFQVATDALNARDYATALTGLQAYLKLQPDAPNKAQVKAAIKQLRVLVKLQASQTGAPTGTG